MASTRASVRSDVAELRPVEVPDRLAQRRGADLTRETSALNKEFLLATIVYDLLWSVFHVGTLATLLNACARINADWTLRPWRHLLNDSGTIMQLALRYGPEIGLTAQVSANTSKLYSDIAAQKLRLVPLVKTAETYSSAERRQVVAACTAWRQLAQDAKAILAIFEAAVVHQLDELTIEDTHTLSQFLADAGTGRVTRVSPSGEISLPVLKQMRREPRVKIHGRCTVIFGDKTITAALKDISASGLGMICDQPLPDKQSVTVVMEDGLRLQGKVASRFGDHVGLLFDSRLNRNDALFYRMNK